MAEKRMISKVISISEKVNELPDIFDMLLFTWIIPHTDDFGRLAGSPAKVKALVIPLLEKTRNEVSESLQRLHDQGLIQWYEVDGEQVIQVTNFEKHQQGLHKRTRSKFPDSPNNSIPPRNIPGNSGNFPKIPLEEKGREQNRTEQKGIEEEGNGTGDSASLSPDLRDSILKLCNECNIQKINLASLEELYSYIGLIEQAVIEIAIKKAQDKHINYAINTLKNWAAEGKTTIDQVNPPPKVAQFKSRSSKPDMEVVSNDTDTQLSEEEYAEYMKLAQQMKAAKEANNGKETA